MHHKEDRLRQFEEAYLLGLEEATRKYPSDYDFGPGGHAAVVKIMMGHIRKGGFSTVNHGGHGIRLTCRRLGIKHTRKAIESFLNGE